MIAKKALDIVLRESETMIVEWADEKSGGGYTVIERELNKFLDKEVTDTTALVVKANVRCFLLQDMAMFGW